MGFQVNNFPLVGIREGIMEGIGDILNANGDILSGRNGNNQPECICC